MNGVCSGSEVDNSPQLNEKFPYRWCAMWNEILSDFYPLLSLLLFHCRHRHLIIIIIIIIAFVLIIVFVNNESLLTVDLLWPLCHANELNFPHFTHFEFQTPDKYINFKKIIIQICEFVNAPRVVRYNSNTFLLCWILSLFFSSLLCMCVILLSFCTNSFDYHWWNLNYQTCSVGLVV